MVNFEAARAICEMKHVTAAQLTKPIAGLFSPLVQLTLSQCALQSCNYSFRLLNLF